MSTHVVVIGAGISGMSCALALSKKGRTVTLVESRPVTGALIRCFHRKNLMFDGGFHYTGAVNAGEHLASVLDSLGVYSKLTIRPLDATVPDRVYFEAEAREVQFAQGWGASEERLIDQFPNDGHAIRAYFARVAEVYDRIPVSFDDPPPQLRLIDSGLDVSLREVLNELTDNRLLQEALISHSMLYGSLPEETPFVFHARVMGGYYQSMSKIEGGGTAIANAMTDAFISNGGRLMTNTTIRKMSVNDNGVIDRLDLTDGECIAADVVVFSGHPSHLLHLLPETSIPARTKKRLSRLQSTYTANLLFCSMPELTYPISNRNSYIRPSSTSPIFGPDQPIEEQSIFISPSDPVQTADGYPFTAIFPCDASAVSQWSHTCKGKRPQEYVDYKAALTDTLVTRLQAIDGFADARVVDSATPLTVGHYYDLPPTTGLYGVKHRFGNVTALTHTHLGNLFLCGQAITAPGLFGGVYSGVMAAQAACGGL